MYREYDFYAIGNKPGVACINPSLYKQISKVKEEGAKVIVIAHWGVDFGKVQIKQREYAVIGRSGSRFNYWTRSTYDAKYREN